ncbi:MULTISPECIES: DUF1684 domain-containing protein [Leucobacter]|uniref:DUF1684 domain-containing protein n=2 Tax=Leucobacter TaxID=55968 RepID=A0ABN3B2Q6_9MICO|nr:MULTISPECIES: DUF1684 domain-containing protein [Leucobacter]MBS3182540.1 DUF1684 domain-containing protein [Leucobacter manosquensis]
MNAASQPAAVPTPESAHEAWRAGRRASVTSATGNLSLIETRWFPGDVDEEAAARLVAAERDAAPEGVTVTSVERKNIASGRAEHGLRVWDANAPAIRAFEEIETFPFDPSWIIEAEFTPVSSDRTVPFEHIRDAGGSRDLVVPGDITFERDGQRFTLAAFDDAGQLLLVFGDPTNGLTDDTGTYGSGRFLFVERDAAEFGEAGHVRLDFNRAFVPPCGFSAQYNCPMPPPQNRLPWPVHAGERLPRFTDGFDIYTI